MHGPGAWSKVQVEGTQGQSRRSAPCCGTMSMSPSALAKHESVIDVLAVYTWIAKPSFCAELHMHARPSYAVLCWCRAMANK